jgi:hypothetical protein
MLLWSQIQTGGGWRGGEARRNCLANRAQPRLSVPGDNGSYGICPGDAAVKVLAGKDCSVSTIWKGETRSN